MLILKKNGLLIVGLFVIFSMIACSKNDEMTSTTMSDYRPMIYLQDNLFGDTGRVTNMLPTGAVLVGTIQKTVPQNEPMVNENYASNALAVGIEVFSDESDKNVIFARTKVDPVEYLIFECLQ